MAGIVALVVLVLLVIVVLQVLGTLIGIAVKIVLLVVAAGIALAVYGVVKKKLGGPRG